jgi:hypothetical protein
MKEIKGDLWDYYGRKGFIVCITTNGFLKKNGEAVMGRGCAWEAKTRFPELPKLLGQKIKLFGNNVYELQSKKLWSFPTKHNWWEKADPDLISKSAAQLVSYIENRRIEFGLLETFILPKPGCSNGQLDWEDVKPLLKDLPNTVWVIDRP